MTAEVTPADYQAYADAMGIDYPTTVREKAEVYTDVVRFKQETGRDDSGPGWVLPAVGLGALGIGGAAVVNELLKRRDARVGDVSRGESTPAATAAAQDVSATPPASRAAAGSPVVDRSTPAATAAAQDVSATPPASTVAAGAPDVDQRDVPPASAPADQGARARSWTETPWGKHALSWVNRPGARVVDVEARETEEASRPTPLQPGAAPAAAQQRDVSPASAPAEGSYLPLGLSPQRSGYWSPEAAYQLEPSRRIRPHEIEEAQRPTPLLPPGRTSPDEQRDVSPVPAMQAPPTPVARTPEEQQAIAQTMAQQQARSAGATRRIARTVRSDERGNQVTSTGGQAKTGYFLPYSRAGTGVGVASGDTAVMASVNPNADPELGAMLQADSSAAGVRRAINAYKGRIEKIPTYDKFYIMDVSDRDRRMLDALESRLMAAERAEADTASAVNFNVQGDGDIDGRAFPVGSTLNVERSNGETEVFFVDNNKQVRPLQTSYGSPENFYGSDSYSELGTRRARERDDGFANEEVSDFTREGDRMVRKSAETLQGYEYTGKKRGTNIGEDLESSYGQGGVENPKTARAFAEKGMRGLRKEEREYYTRYGPRDKRSNLGPLVNAAKAISDPERFDDASGRRYAQQFGERLAEGVNMGGQAAGLYRAIPDLVKTHRSKMGNVGDQEAVNIIFEAIEMADNDFFPAMQAAESSGDPRLRQAAMALRTTGAKGSATFEQFAAPYIERAVLGLSMERQAGDPTRPPVVGISAAGSEVLFDRAQRKNPQHPDLAGAVNELIGGERTALNAAIKINGLTSGLGSGLAPNAFGGPGEEPRTNGELVAAAFFHDSPGTETYAGRLQDRVEGGNAAGVGKLGSSGRTTRLRFGSRSGDPALLGYGTEVKQEIMRHVDSSLKTIRPGRTDDVDLQTRQVVNSVVRNRVKELQNRKTRAAKRGVSREEIQNQINAWQGIGDRISQAQDVMSELSVLANEDISSFRGDKPSGMGGLVLDRDPTSGVYQAVPDLKYQGAPADLGNPMVEQEAIASEMAPVSGQAKGRGGMTGDAAEAMGPVYSAGSMSEGEAHAALAKLRWENAKAHAGRPGMRTDQASFERRQQQIAEREQGKSREREQRELQDAATAHLSNYIQRNAANISVEPDSSAIGGRSYKRREGSSTLGSYTTPSPTLLKAIASRRR